MLETVDLTRTLPKQEYGEVFPALELRLGECQRAARERGVPLIGIFEGWDAVGKGTHINRIALALDARGFKVHAVSAPNDEERMRPWMWRFWTALPAAGRVAIFDRSWYGRVLVERVEGHVSERELQEAYEEIMQFERQLGDSGAVIVKFWLHMSKKEQKRRLKRLEKDPSLSWKVTKEEWRHHKQYEDYLEAVEEMLGRTSTAYAPWTIVEAHDRRFARVRVAETIIRAWERALSEDGAEQAADTEAAPEGPTLQRTAVTNPLDRVDLSLSLDRDTYMTEKDNLQERLLRLEHEIYVHRIPVVIVYEGWDAGGKGGNIRRLLQGLDPRGYEVVPIAAPTDEELAHHYLWRFWRHVPKAGHITIFDRSWYGRVMVERIEGFCTTQEWRRAFQEIREFEGQLVSAGTVLIKFWLDLSPEEQLRRFRDRENTPHKSWKMTDEDWRNRDKWDAYKQAVGEMIQKTSTVQAPWTIVEGDSKLFARVKAMRTVADAMEAALKRARK